MSVDPGLSAAPGDEPRPAPAARSSPSRRGLAAGREGARQAAARAATEPARRRAAVTSPPASPVVAPVERPPDMPVLEPTPGAVGASVTAMSSPPVATPTEATPYAPVEPPGTPGVAPSTNAPVGPGTDAREATGPEGRRLTRQERKAKVRMRARRVRRVIRHVDPWSVLKLSLILYLCLFVIVMVAGVILWNIAQQAGTIDDVQNLFRDLGLFETFTFEGDKIFRACALGGLALVIAGTGLNVLFSVLFNLISDLVGGVRITVIEEDSARPVAPPVLPAGARPGADGTWAGAR